jgi:hypothetical protein
MFGVLEAAKQIHKPLLRNHRQTLPRNTKLEFGCPQWRLSKTKGDFASNDEIARRTTGWDSSKSYAEILRKGLVGGE